MRESAKLLDAIFNKLKQERVFSKRSRWLFAQKIADMANDYMAAIEEANKPKVQTAELRVRRYNLQQIALGKLSALDVIIEAARRNLDIPPNEFEDIAARINKCEDLIQAWVKSDERRYGSPSEADRI